jgi:hypothetical protein
VKDEFTIWMISGVIGAAVRDGVDFISLIVFHSKNVIWNIAADVFINTAQVHTPLGNVLGLLGDLTIGGMLGIVVGLTLKWTSPKNYLLKGWGLGLAAWFLFFGVLLHNLPHSQGSAPVDPLVNIVAFLGHSIFGIVTAWVNVILSRMEKKNW